MEHLQSFSSLVGSVFHIQTAKVALSSILDNYLDILAY